MQQRLLQAGRGVAEEAFHDYLSDFYEDKLDKLRRALNQQLLANDELKHRHEATLTQLGQLKLQQENGPVTQLTSLIGDQSQGNYRN